MGFFFLLSTRSRLPPINAWRYIAEFPKYFVVHAFSVLRWTWKTRWMESRRNIIHSVIRYTNMNGEWTLPIYHMTFSDTCETFPYRTVFHAVYAVYALAWLCLVVSAPLCVFYWQFLNVSWTPYYLGVVSRRFVRRNICDYILRSTQKHGYVRHGGHESDIINENGKFMRHTCTRCITSHGTE